PVPARRVGAHIHRSVPARRVGAHARRRPARGVAVRGVRAHDAGREGARGQPRAGAPLGPPARRRRHQRAERRRAGRRALHLGHRSAGHVLHCAGRRAAVSQRRPVARHCGGVGRRPHRRHRRLRHRRPRLLPRRRHRQSLRAV
ncbi:hypothetical protein LPJ63_002870, partial [Coemansia sp. RSA 2711]